ncbi:hypothetical protein KW568_03325 [Pseudomonas sp. HD6515]|uniref:DnaT-like ssDNA-binding domain-containing protein n=1 Tax=Pseudomonas sp. HD6515 TaxID=2856556 RepID=UPI00217E7BDE|nr:DnaT-like ssDNA-binding domain-containing protein [Pseudomonas sp. HD6515]ELS0926022.1 hypothetical protein [Pseudomonas putida]UWH23464.1 hypothetical protein KW568_03325 [Pseudomonas sp. HD6515]
MIAIRLDQSEWDLLAGEPAELLKLYCALKRRMDFSTGIAGRKTLINEVVLREGFTVDPIRGRATPKPVTREQYRSAVRRLETLGLLNSIGPLVFEFPQARSDRPSKSFATDLQPNEQPDQQPLGNDLEPSDSGAFGGSGDDLQPNQQPPTSPISNLLPESGKSPTTLSARGYFAMHDGWQPQAKTWGPTALRNAIPKAVPAETLNEFRSYWIARPDKEQSQAQWEHQLAQSLKHHIRQAQAGGYTHGNSRAGSGGSAAPGQQRRLSAVDRVEANVAAQRAARGEGPGTPEPWTAGETLDHDDPDVWPQVDQQLR